MQTAALYLVLLGLFRLSGKRTLAQITTIDLVLLLIVSEATQQALLGDDYSLTNAVLVITVLIFTDRMADALKFRSKAASRLLEGEPLLLVAHGRPLTDRLRKEHISTDDILVTARKTQGLTRIEDIEYAVLESSGGISIVPAAQEEQNDESPARG